MVLVVLGVVLLMPPVAGIFDLETKIAGLPFTVVYLFAVWAVLILGARWVARRLEPPASGEDPAP